MTNPTNLPGTIPRLMTTAEVAAILRIHPQSLERWRRHGEGPPFVKLNGRVRYLADLVESYVVGAARVSSNQEK